MYCQHYQLLKEGSGFTAVTFVYKSMRNLQRLHIKNCQLLYFEMKKKNVNEKEKNMKLPKIDI